MTQKHTPGPWKTFETIEGISWDIQKESGQHIATVSHNACNTFKELEVNARLIASAPELLEALKEIINIARPYLTSLKQGNVENDMSRIIKEAQAVIAKVEGQ